MSPSAAYVPRSTLLTRGRTTRWWAIAIACTTTAARAQSDEPVTVVVQQTRHSPPRYDGREPTLASSVVEGEELHQAGRTTTDILRRLPGVAVSRTGAQSDLATASIRGSSSAQVPVYLAGVRINDEVSGAADLSTVPLWMLGKVEVFRGNAPERADQLGLGGAVFFWPRKPTKNRVGAGGQLSSFGGQGQWLAYESGNEQSAALVAVRRDQAQNDYPFVNDFGQRFDVVEQRQLRPNADFRTHDAWAVGHSRFGKHTRLSLVTHALDREQGMTGLAVIPAEHARARVRRLLTAATAQTSCALGEECQLDAQAALLLGRLTLQDPYLEHPALRSRLLFNTGKRQSYRIRGRSYLRPDLELGASLNQSSDELDLTRVRNLPSTGRRSSTRLAATGHWYVNEDLELTALGALECHTTRGSAPRLSTLQQSDSGRCGVLAPTTRIGAQYRLTESLSLLSNAGRYVRVPTLSELYGSSPLAQGNDALVPERGLTVDLGLRQNLQSGTESFYVEAFGFVRTAEQLIRFRRTGLNTTAPFNVASARIIGLESALYLDALQSFVFSASATLLDPRETTSDPAIDPTPNDILPLASRLVTHASLEVYSKPGLSILQQDRVSITLAYLYRSARFDDPAGLTVLPEQSLWDLTTSTSHLQGRIIARFAMRNLLDTEQYDLIGLPVPPRSVHAEMEAWW